jgi:hypothetical protein
MRLLRTTGPSWLDIVRFDVIAKVPEGTTTAAIPGMLQALLADRFHLRKHRDTSPSPVLCDTARSNPRSKVTICSIFLIARSDFDTNSTNSEAVDWQPGQLDLSW